MKQTLFISLAYTNRSTRHQSSQQHSCQEIGCFGKLAAWPRLRVLGITRQFFLLTALPEGLPTGSDPRQFLDATHLIAERSEWHTGSMVVEIFMKQVGMSKAEVSAMKSLIKEESVSD